MVQLTHSSVGRLGLSFVVKLESCSFVQLKQSSDVQWELSCGFQLRLYLHFVEYF